MQHPKVPGLGVISGADRVIVRTAFGAEPTSHAVPILAPPPPTTDGTVPMEVEAHSFWYEEWKALRRSGIGASEVACVAGIPGAYGSPFALWWNKKAGLEVEQETDEILVMGTRLEAIIGNVWAERNPHAILCRPGAGLFAHPGLPWLMATPDFVAVSIVDGVVSIEPVECKAYDGGRGWGTPGTDQVPEHVLCQVMVQCEVLGAKRGHVARMQGKRITTYVIDAYPIGDEGRRRALMDVWLKRAQAFHESTSTDHVPPLDGSDATEAVLAFQFSDVHAGEESTLDDDLIRRYRWALDNANEAQRNLALMRNKVRAAMGNAEYATDTQGERVAQRRVYKRREYTVPSGMVDGVWPIGAKR